MPRWSTACLERPCRLLPDATSTSGSRPTALRGSAGLPSRCSATLQERSFTRRREWGYGEMTPLEPLEIHVAGTTLGRRRHLCAFFHTLDERYRVLLPFVREGIERGEKN